MKKNLYALASCLLLTFSAQAQATNPIITSWLLNATGITGFNSLEANVQSVKYSNTSVYVASKGIPSYSSTYTADGSGSASTTWYGQPTTGPVAVTYTTYRMRLPLTPTPNTGTPVAVPGGVVGLWINGTNIHPAKDAASYNTSTGTVTNNGSGVWFTDAVVNEGIGFDNCNGHPDIANIYHTHVNPDCLYDRRDSTRHSPIIGFALDGYPIYGAYGYKVATDATSGIKSMKSSYRLRSITVRTHLSNGDGVGGTVLAVSAGPAVTAGNVMTNNPLGKFVGDNEYIAGLGDLNANNGRWCVTPEYPGGTYAYFATINSFYEGAYPYTVAGTYYGTVPYTNTNSTTATITGGEAAALQTYTNPGNLTVSTNKVLGGGTFTSVTVASGGNLVVVDPLTVSGAMTVQSGGAIDLGTLDANSATVGGTGSFTLASGAKIRLDNTAGLTSSGATGAVQNTGTRTFDAGAAYVYEHTAAQATGNGLPASPKTLTFNNSSTTGVTLSQSLTVPASGTLTLKDGQLITASGKNLSVSGTFDAGTEQVTGAGNFTLSSGATLKTAHANGIRTATPNGTVVSTGTRTFDAGASYEFTGTAAQTTSAALPATVAGLTINNSSATGVTLTNGVTVTSALTLTKGTLNANGKTITINSGATASTGTNTITGTGTFTLSSGATLKTGHAAGITSAVATTTGAVQTTTARSFNTGASYEYNGTAAQVTGTGLPATVANLTINNAAGVALTSDVTTTTALTLTSGVLTTGTQKVLLNGSITESDASYVTGTVQATRTLSSTTANSFGGLGLTLTPAGTTFPGSTVALRVTGTAPTGANSSSGIQRYFSITPAANNGSLNVTLQMAYREAELNGLAEGSLAFFKSTSSPTAGPWLMQPLASTTRNAAANTVTLTGVTGFSTWTLGSTASPLPVALTAFAARRQPTGAVHTSWATASEHNSAGFVLERSTDGRSFRAVSEPVAAAGHSTQARAYAWTDATAPAGGLYYRLRQLDTDGSARYSPVATVGGAAEATAWTLYPNPATGLVYLQGLPAGQAVTLHDALGRPVRTALAPAETDLTFALDGLPAGLYVLRCGSHTRRLTVQ